MRVRDRVFLVTGAGSGLGRATALHLASRGGYLMLADVQQAAGADVAELIGSRARFVRTDVCDGASAQAAVDLAVQSFGSLHGLINCAGVASARRVLLRDGPQELEAFSRVVQINLIGSFNMLRVAADAMRKNQPDESGERGIVINTASVAAFDGQIGQAAYAASKAGVAGMTLPLARELGQHGIRVLTIAPGIMATPMMLAMPAPVQASLAATVPFPARMGQPDEFAQLVAHMIENSYLNGEVVRLDGGLRMGAT